MQNSKIIYEIYSSLDGATFLKSIHENGTEKHIPIDEANSDYQAYLASLEDK